MTRRRRGLLAGLLVLAVFAAYAPAISGGLLWDDAAHLTKPELRSPGGLARIWFEPGATQQYYPLLHSAFWLEHRLWGDALAPYHAINLGWHAGAAVLLALLLEGWFSAEAAWFAAWVFALHPVGVESVAWISEQKNTLSLVFSLLAAGWFQRWWNERGKGGWGLYWGATAWFVAALLTKSVCATLPVVLWIVLQATEGGGALRRGQGENATRASRPRGAALAPWVGLGAVAGGFTAWMERHVIGAQGAAFALSAVERVAIAGRAVWFYAGKLCWPHPLIFVYPRWNPARTGAGLAGAALALGLTAVLWLLWRRGRRGPLAVWATYVCLLGPVLGFLNVYPFIFSFVADHFQYQASIAVFSGLGWAWGAWRGRAPLAALFAAGALMITLGLATWSQSHHYRDVRTLYTVTLERNPDAWLAHLNLGNMDLEAGALDSALSHYAAAERIYSDYPDTHFNAGRAWLQAGDPARAAAEFSTLLRLSPGDAEAHDNLGVALANLGRMTEAEREFARAVELAPRSSRARLNHAAALEQLGRAREAAGERAAAQP